MKLAQIDAYFLNRCKELATIADSHVFPNPKVGSLIVHEGKIIGEGFHKKPGTAHGEVAAVATVENKALLSSSSLYVNLEPCNHYGKTPPCTDLILQHRIPRVVIGSLDPNPKVAGSGVAKLREHGVTVLLSENPQPFVELNRVFFFNQVYNRAFIILKWAESSDNFIATYSQEGQPIPTRISGHQSMRLAHKLRAENQAIMVGRNTAAVDNPRLNTRLFPGETPLRIILDKSLKLSTDLNIFQGKYPSLILNEKKHEQKGSLRFYKPRQFSNLKMLSEELYQELGICSILVEGGSSLLQQYVDQQAYEEIYRVEAQKKLFKGVSGPKLSKDLVFAHKSLDREDQLFHHKGPDYAQLLATYQSELS